MYTFQSIPVEQLNMNPFTKIGKEWALVTSGDSQKCNTMTVSWGGVGVLWGKNVVFIFIRDSRYTKEFIDSQTTFSLSFPGEEYRKALQYCGTVSGRTEDKLKNAGLTLDFAQNIPYPKEANLVMLCKSMAAVPLTSDTFISSDLAQRWYADGDMHTMYVGEIMDVLEAVQE